MRAINNLIKRFLFQTQRRCIFNRTIAWFVKLPRVFPFYIRGEGKIDATGVGVLSFPDPSKGGGGKEEEEPSCPLSTFSRSRKLAGSKNTWMRVSRASPSPGSSFLELRPSFSFAWTPPWPTEKHRCRHVLRPTCSIYFRLDPILDPKNRAVSVWHTRPGSCTVGAGGLHLSIGSCILREKRLMVRATRAFSNAAISRRNIYRRQYSVYVSCEIVKLNLNYEFNGYYVTKLLCVTYCLIIIVRVIW